MTALAQYTDAIFFDNDMNNITSVGDLCRKIVCVKIPETDPKPTTPFTLEPLLSYIEPFKDNGYYKLIRASFPDDTYDYISGIQREHIQQLYGWITTTRGKRVAIFDWDRTITVFEGIVGGGQKMSMATLFTWFKIVDPNPVESTLLYLCGGEERLRMLREMFDECTRNSIDIIILTNNANAEPGTVFTDITKGLVPTATIICAGCKNMPPELLNNKGMVLRNDPRFSRLLCATSGGRKSRKQRKSRKHSSR